MHDRVRLKSALHWFRTSLAIIFWVLIWVMRIVIILPILSIGVLRAVGGHAILIELLLIHKGGLPMLFKLALRMLVILLAHI